jgi:HEAT repeat protein
MGRGWAQRNSRSSSTRSNGGVLLNVEHPVLAQQIAYHQSQDPDHFAAQVQREVFHPESTERSEESPVYRRRMSMSWRSRYASVEPGARLPAMDSPPEADLSTDELFARALEGGEEDPSAWRAIWQLHHRGGEDVFQRAAAWLQSSSPKERGRGANILSQLEFQHRGPERVARFTEVLLSALAREQDAAVLEAMAAALGHLGAPRAVPALLPLMEHPDAPVRFGVVMGLSRHRDARALQALIQLSRDPDATVREWATFTLGSQAREVDTPELRDALVDRLHESHVKIRGEALLGLALRKDARVLEPLRRVLEGPTVTTLDVEAAQALEDVSLLPLLLAHREAFDEEDEDPEFHAVLFEAIHVLESLAR